MSCTWPYVWSCMHQLLCGSCVSAAISYQQSVIVQPFAQEDTFRLWGSAPLKLLYIVSVSKFVRSAHILLYRHVSCQGHIRGLFIVTDAAGLLGFLQLDEDVQLSAALP